MCRNAHLLLLAVLLAACGDAKSAAPGEKSPQQGNATLKAAKAPAPPQTAADAKRSPAPALVVARQGAVGLEGEPEGKLEQGTPLPAERTLSLPDGSKLTLDMPNGARVVVQGPALLRVGRDRLRQLIIARGQAHVQLAPEGATRRLSLRVATPHLSAELAGHAQAWIGVADESFVGVASGSATVTRGDSASPTRQGVDLQPGQSVLSQREGLRGQPQAQARTIEALAAQGRALLVAPDGAPAAADVGATLDAAIDELLALRAQGEELTRRQRAAKDATNKAQAKQVQQALVEYAQQLYRLRRRVLTLWERQQASALRDGALPPLAAQAARVRALIGAVDS